jgi:hypothetical protein
VGTTVGDCVERVGEDEGVATLGDGDAGTVAVGETVVKGALGAHAGIARRSATSERTRNTAFSLRQLRDRPASPTPRPGAGFRKRKKPRGRR